MRDIKFRALTKEGNIIEDVGSIQFFEDGIIIVNDEFPVKQLIEFTGLVDKNGKEIYCSDILKGNEKLAGGTLEVTWSDGGFIFGAEDALNEQNIELYELEVIGNIFKNPGLLT